MAPPQEVPSESASFLANVHRMRTSSLPKLLVMAPPSRDRLFVKVQSRITGPLSRLYMAPPEPTNEPRMVKAWLSSNTQSSIEGLLDRLYIAPP